MICRLSLQVQLLALITSFPVSSTLVLQRATAFVRGPGFGGDLKGRTGSEQPSALRSTRGLCVEPTICKKKIVLRMSGGGAQSEEGKVNWGLIYGLGFGVRARRSSCHNDTTLMDYVCIFCTECTRAQNQVLGHLLCSRNGGREVATVF
jgi:hypothetical protein